MDNLATQHNSTALAQYSRSLADKSYADQYETLLGHLICERGKDVKSALENLRPIVKTTHKQTLSARDWCAKLGFGGLGIGVLIGSSPLGIAFAIAPLAAGTVSLKLWADSRNELPRREAEYHLLKTVVDLPEALYALHLRGVDAVRLVGAYDALVVAIEGRLEDGRDFTEAEVGEFLRVKIETRTGLETSIQAQSGFQPENAQDAPKTESQPLAQTELQPIAPGVAAAPSMSMVNGVESIAARDIATDLGNNPQSALIFGTPGAGKGMNISNAIRTLRAKFPAATIMMVDPKGDKKECGYWESQVDIFESRSLLKSSPRSSAEWMMRCIEKFQNLDGTKLLIWDELFATITVLKGQNVPKGEDAFPCLTDFQQFLGLHLSLGPSSGVWVWGMSQSANLSDLGLTSGGLSTTRIIALISPDNVGAVEGYLATKAITAPKGGMDTLNKLMEASPVGRACYDGKTKRWYPMARLENHSGFDRDNADWNNLGNPAPETRSPSPSIAPPSSSTRLSVGQVNWEYLKVGSPMHPQATDAVDVETVAIDDQPDGLEDFPLVLTIWEYLNGKNARSMKQIRDAMRKTGRITDDSLKEKLPAVEGYNEGLKAVIDFGVGKGFLKEVSDGCYEAIKKH